MIIKEFRNTYIMVATECDWCKEKFVCNDVPDDWHIISVMHNDWGNDSIESMESYLVCSPVCYIRLLEKILDDFADYESAEIDGFSIKFVKELIKYLDS